MFIDEVQANQVFQQGLSRKLRELGLDVLVERFRGEHDFSTGRHKQLAGMATQGVEAGDLAWVDVRDYGAMTAAVTAIGATPTTLYIPDEQAVTTDVTVPATLTLKFGPGGFLSIPTDVTVTVNGNIDAGLTKIFSCTGTGKVILNKAKEVYPEWWGAKNDGTNATMTTSAIKSALVAVTKPGVLTATAAVKLQDYSSIYLINDTINFNIHGIRFKGNFATIKLSDNTNKDMININPGIVHLKIEDLILDGNKANQSSGGIGILINRGLWLTLKRIYIHDTYSYGIKIAATDAIATTIFIEKFVFTDMVNAVYIEGTANPVMGIHIDETTFQSLTGAALTLEGNSRNCSVKRSWFESIARGIYSINAPTYYTDKWDISDNYVSGVTNEFINIPSLTGSRIVNNSGAFTIVLDANTEGNVLESSGTVTDLGRNFVRQSYMGTGTWGRGGGESLSYQLSYNFAKNAGLERWSSNLPADWISTGGTISEESTIIYEGKRSCKLVTTTSAQNILQSITIPMSRKVTLSAWVKASAAAKAWVQMWDNINGTTAGVKNTTTDWEKISVSIAVEPTAISLKIMVVADINCTLYIDGIVVTEGFVTPAVIPGCDELKNRTIQTFAVNDTTPSVNAGDVFKTANTGATIISMFNDGVEGQGIKVLIQDVNTTIDFTGTNLKGNGGANWGPTTGDWLEAIFDGVNWYCSVHDCTA